MLRLQRFLAIPMAASAVACLWLLYRLGGLDAFAWGFAAASILILMLWWIGSLQFAGQRVSWVLVVLVGTAFIFPAFSMPTYSSAPANVPIGAEAWSEAAVEKYRAQGKPVFVYFTADWCLTCKANEAAAIEREATREAFTKAGVKVLAGDWTNGDPAITRFLESRGRAGVPLYLWYAPGQAEPEELPQILTPGMLVERAQGRN